MNDKKSYELFMKIHASAGMKFINQQHARSFSYNIFRGNMEELLKYLGVVENVSVGMKLMSDSHIEEGTQAHREANRLFHNFLASAMTLVYHTRNFMKKHHKDMPIYTSYLQKVEDELANDPLCKFIQELRNYMLHEELPHSKMSLKIKKDEYAESTISINCEKLGEWKWSKAARAYLNESPKDLKMSILSEAYGRKISEFHLWLDNALVSAHKRQLEELEQFQKLYRQLENT